MFAACGGDDGTGDVAAVFPDSGFTGRKVRVEVSGDTTSWDATTTVNFGTGVTVDTVTVISPSSLQVDLTIDAAATPSAHDVTVTDSGSTVTLVGAFTLKAPIAVEIAPNFEQGGFGTITLTNNDLLNPFDLTQDMNQNFINLAVSNAGDGVTLAVANATGDTVTLSAQIDVFATTSGPITLASTNGGTTLMNPIGEVPVAARTAIPLNITGTPSVATLTDNGNLFEITAVELGMLHVDLTTTDANAFVPGFTVLPASGKFADTADTHINFASLIGDDPTTTAALDNRIVATGDKFFLIAQEFGGGGGYDVTLKARSIPLTGVTAVVDTGTNTTPANAQALSGTIAEFDGVLTDKTDVDCVKIPMAASKKLHVFTTDEDGASDTVVTLTDTNATTSLGTSNDVDLGEEISTDVLVPLSATGRFACFKSSGNATNAPYKAIIVIE